MRKSLVAIIAVALLGVGGVAAFYFTHPDSPPDEIATILRDRLSAIGLPRKAAGEKAPLKVGIRPQNVQVDRTGLDELSRRFYSNRSYKVAWIDARGAQSHAKALLDALRRASEEGLEPADYEIDLIEDVLKRTHRGILGPSPSAEQLADLDILLTRTFFRYATDLSAGQVRPEEVSRNWHTKPSRLDLAKLLDGAIATNRIPEMLTELPPPFPEYGRLKTALARHAEIAARGGWPTMSEGDALKAGSRGPRVLTLRQRLALSGDLADSGRNPGDVYDRTLENAVKSFQERHGLEPTGVAGPETLTELNTPVEERLRLIRQNLERWRWIPKDIGARYIMVNVPGFDLKVVEDGKAVMTMRVIAGKALSATPIFSDQITYLVFNPTWNVPEGIAAGEIIPTFLKDSAYLSKNRIRVFDGPGDEAREIDPGSVDLSGEGEGKTKYFFRQDPGPVNPLGRVKFMMPNPFDIYLHDTPAGHLFARAERDFSHGCIRLEKAADLAEYLLKENPRWTRDSIISAMEGGDQQTVSLSRPILTHILYWTAWVDEDGTIQFREDVYGLDRALAKELQQTASPARSQEKAAKSP